MAFGLAAYVSRCWLPVTAKTGFQVLVKLSWAGFHPQGSDKRFSTYSIRVIPPFPSFLAQTYFVASIRMQNFQ